MIRMERITMSDVSNMRYCKKCGRELMSTNKKKLCQNCRRKRSQNIKNVVVGIGTAVGGFTTLFIGKKFNWLKRK